MCRSPAPAGLLAAFLLLLAWPATAATRLLVAVGEPAPTSAVLWVRAAGEGEVVVDYGPAGGSARARVGVAVSEATDLTGRVQLADLRPATRYRYQVRSGSDTASGEFVTAPAADVVAPVRFVWSGDLGSSQACRRRDGGYPIFRAMAASRPDFFLFVGDTIYADHVCAGEAMVPGADFIARTLPEYRAKHRYNRSDPAAAAFYAGTAVLPIWDDHEVRNDFAGPGEPLMPVGRQAFLDYWPLLPPAEESGRLYRRLRWGRLLEVFILDTRQYRSANDEPDGPGKTMLGPAQRRWLIEGVTTSTATWKVVVSSVPLSIPTGRAARDSWSSAGPLGVPVEGTGFAFERDAILRAFRRAGVKNLIFLAADVHHAALIRHQPWPDLAFHEFVAGPLSAIRSRPRPLDQSLNPRSLFARGGINNFGEITIEPALLRVRIVAEDGAELFTHVIGPEEAPAREER